MSSIFNEIPRSSLELEELREERAEMDMDYIPFLPGEEVICIFAQSTKNLRNGHVYTVKGENKDKIFLEVSTGNGKSYLAEYMKWRFTFPNIKQKCREIKIDSIV